MSAIPSSCSLHEKLQTHCGSSRGKESFVLLSESNSNTSAHLASCHLSKCGDITEAELMLRKERAFVDIRELDYLPETWTFISKIWLGEWQRRASTLARKIGSVVGRQVIIGVVDEMILLFGKIAAVGSRKYDYPLRYGVFFSVVRFH